MKKVRVWWEWWFLLGISLVPFAYSFPGVDNFEVFKANVILFWVLGLLFLSVFRVNKKWVYDKRMLRGIVWLLASMVISSIFGESLKRSMFGNYWRGDGLLVYGSLFLMSLSLSSFVNNDLLLKIKTVLVSTSVGLGFWSLVVQVFGVFMFSTHRWMDGGVGLSFGNPNFLAGYLLLSLPLIYRLESKYRYLFFGLVSVGIYGTGAWLGLMGVLFWVALEFFLIIKSKKLKIMFALSGLLVIIVAIVAWLHSNSIQSKLGQLPESRDRIVRKMILGWWERPILGYGWVNVDKAFGKVDWPMKFYDDVYLDKAHSMGLEYLVTTGIIGFSAYIWLIYLVGNNLYSIKYKGWWVLFVLYVVHSQTNVISLAEEMVWFVMVGIGLSKKRS